MGQPLISIVLTTFNSEGTIKDVLDAILRQNMPLSTIELIVVDGGSRDQTIEIVKSFMEKSGSLFHGVKMIVHERNYGVSKARNDGMKTSTGRYILVLDHDVIMNESTLTSLLKFLESSPSDVAAVMPLHLEYPESTLGKWLRLIRENRVTRTSAITSCALIKREAIEKIGFYNETLGPPFTIAEDTEYGARAKSRGYYALVAGFEKVLHVNEEVWRDGKRHRFENFVINAKIKEEIGKERSSFDAWRKVFSAIISIKNASYRYAYKKYVKSLPLLDKLRWCTYLATTLLMALLIAMVCISSTLSMFFFVIQPIALTSLTLCLALYIDALREYWNPKVLHISLAYSAVALLWRMLRSTMLLTFMSAKRPGNPSDDCQNSKGAGN